MVAKVRVVLDFHTAEIAALGSTAHDLTSHLVASIVLDKWSRTFWTLSSDSLGHGFVSHVDWILGAVFICFHLLARLWVMIRTVAQAAIGCIARLTIHHNDALIINDPKVVAFLACPEEQN